MLRRRVYYSIKPFMPWRVRAALRRIHVRRIRAASRNLWPINEAAGAKPPGWNGWPENKKFALVLTHDVEDQAGLDKCRQLATLEMELGFKSSFNLIPEGPYQSSAELRSWLAENGFEVGIHDHRHDGKLFHTHRGFKKGAQRINHYLQDWNVAGFRAGFMLRNLDWIHELDIDYDASTFDTDPFEPQPDGAGTIFPQWIPAPHGVSTKNSGYVELPYTLPQDSTLFLFLEETTPEIWMRKLDWVAEHGGMALINVHPDYLNFDGQVGAKEYTHRHYSDFLRYVQQKYAGQYWHACANQVASWYRSQHTPVTPTDNTHPNLRGKRAAVILYSTFPTDPRPNRAAEAMAEAGMTVDVLCLAESEKDAPQEKIGNINVTRVPMQRQRGSKITYLLQYGRFLFSSFWFLTKRCLRKKYDFVHVHNMPDFLVFAALLPRLQGTRIILDIHDPMPELMVTIYNLPPKHWFVSVLRLFERLSIGFAHLVLTPNIAFKTLFVSRSTKREAKVQIVMNSPQEKLFNPDRVGADAAKSTDQREFRIMHHGSIVHRHGIDLLVEAVARVREQIPGVRLDIYGGKTAFVDNVLARAQELNIGDIVHYHGPKPQREIAEAIRECDLGIVPNRLSVFTEINFPTRLFEYLSMHRPVIAPSTQGIRDYFSDSQMIFFKPEDVGNLAEQILWVARHPQETADRVHAGIEVYRHHLWSQEKSRFLSLVSELGSK